MPLQGQCVQQRVQRSRRGGTFSFIGTYHLGSTIRVADASFTAVDGMRYTPFGVSRDAGTNLRTDHKFTSQIEDASIGVYWYASRAYDPVIGRFTAPDNIVPEPGNPQALNRYSYVANNPLRFVDPSGHAWEDDFRDAHGGQDPTEQDRFDYELSLLTGHAWTDHDWQKTYESRQSLWSLTKLDDGGQAGQSQPASSGPVIGGPVIFVPTPVFDIVWKFAKGKDRERQRLRLNTMRVQLQYSESGSTPFTDSVVLVGAEPGDPVTSAQVKEGLDILYGKNYIPNSLRGEASAALQVAKDAVDNIVRGGGAWQSRHYVTAPFGARGRSSWRWDVVNDYGHNLRS